MFKKIIFKKDLFKESNPELGKQLMECSNKIDKSCVIPLQEAISQKTLAVVENFCADFKPMKEINSQRKTISLDYEVF
jgi:hypothetical protein